MQYCELRIRLPDAMLHPMQAFIRSEDAVSYEEIVAWRAQPGTDLEYVLFYVEGDLDRYTAAADDIDSVVHYEVSRIDDRSAHVWACEETRPEDRAWRQAFVDRDVIVVPPIRYDHEAAMAMTLVGDAAAVEDLIAEIPQNIDVSVLEIGSYDRRGGTVAASLTDRQLEAIQTARELGYYDVPRTATLADVADALACTESTASVTLRRAERDLLTATLDRYGGEVGWLTGDGSG